ncbi:MAG TPA: hypothetical protein DCG75_03610 [Bacteroidales bacterium]|nr:hypothetical protein [Bacteroidales bacterium]
MRIWKLGEQRDHDYKNVDLRGFRFNIELVANAFSKTVAQLRAAFDMSKIDVNIVLTSAKGKRLILMTGDLQTLAMETNFNDNSFDYVHPDSTQAIDLLTGAADKYQKILIPVELMLGQAINVRGGASIKLEVNFRQDCVVDAAVINTALATINVSEMTAIGVQWTTPITEVHLIPQNQTEFKLALGDNVTSITFINKDKDSVKTADQVIKDVRFVSDRFNAMKTYYDLLCDRVDSVHHDYDAGHMLRNQSFILFSGSEMDRAEMTINLEALNVNTGQNYVVVRKYNMYKKVVREGIRRTAKHESKLDEKLEAAS